MDGIQVFDLHDEPDNETVKLINGKCHCDITLPLLPQYGTKAGTNSLRSQQCYNDIPMSHHSGDSTGTLYIIYIFISSSAKISHTLGPTLSTIMCSVESCVCFVMCFFFSCAILVKIFMLWLNVSFFCV